jgi:hypothetical protein
MSVLAALILASFLCGASAAAKKNFMPPYRQSGVIPGTNLKYEKLTVAGSGEVNVTIVNPGNYGVSFTSNFSFYNGKNEYLTGFTVQGFASANGKAHYALELGDYKAYRKAASMKVLGRSGRMGKSPGRGEGETE